MIDEIIFEENKIAINLNEIRFNEISFGNVSSQIITAEIHSPGNIENIYV